MILVLAISLPCFAKKKVELIGRWDLKTKSITFQLPVQTWVQDNNKDLLGEFVYNQSIVTKPSVVISLDEEAKNGDVVSITDGINHAYGNIFTNL